MNHKLGIIGVGVMGQAILHCAVEKKIVKPEDVALFDVDSTKLNEYRNKYNIYDNAQDLIDNSKYVLLSIKPQHFAGLAENVCFKADNTIISIMAGTKIEKILSLIKTECGIARVMPNTPCRIGKGVCAVCFRSVNEQDKNFIIGLLSSCGKTVPIDEKFFDAVTSISGSGPAYVYMFIDAMIKGGIEGGLSYEQSKTLTINTIIGTSYFAAESDENMESLTEKVCSKGGTTIEAVNIYRKEGLEELVQKGMTACRKRSEEMGKI